MKRIIASYLDQTKNLFVFPSEVAGEYQLRRAVLSGGRRVIRSDRFISWDRLKEREFSPSRERLPSNTLYRTLFSMSLLEEHVEKGPLLRVLLGGRSGDEVSVFRNQIALMLPQLQKAVRMLDEGGTGDRSGFPVALEQDLRLLYERYIDFLEKNGLFEPAYIAPVAGSSEYRYHIFYPELIEDYKEYRNLIEERDNFLVHSIADHQGPETEPRSILRFENARKELQYMVGRINALLEAGVHPGDMAVTLPDYEAWQPFLEEEARVRDIPLDFRAGRKLSEYPAGLLFQRIADLMHNGMALDRLKQLVLEPAYPWREREALEGLVRFGVDHFFVRNLPGKAPGADTVSEKLKKAGIPELLRIFTSLKGQFRRMMSSGTAAELQQEVHKFLKTFFDPEGWDPEAEKVLQYCLLVLRELREAEERLPAIKISSPYALWISLMEKQIYVASAKKGMLPVYRYRVSAGIIPRYHFIPGAGQAETRVNQEDFPFLRDDHRAMLSGNSAPDFSRDFLTVYAASGEYVYMSCSDRGFGGPQLPPAELMEAGLVLPVGEDAPPMPSPPAESAGPARAGRAAQQEDDRIFSDPYPEEERFWAFEGEFPERLFSLQKEGFAAMDRTGFAPKKIDHTRSVVSDVYLKERIGKVVRGERGARDGRIWLSPTSFDRYAGCPYLFFLQSGLKLGQEEYTSTYIEHLQMGSMLHSVLSELYRRVQEEDGRWRSEHTDRYLQIAAEEIRAEFDAVEKKGLAFLKPAWEWFRAAAGVQVETFIREEGKFFDGYELAGTEKDMEWPLPGGKAGMHGRIDRLSVMDGKAALVDYKKGNMPGRKDVYHEENLPAASQLAFYAHVAERNDYRVASASYYSLRDGRFSNIYVHPDAPMADHLGRARPVLQPGEFADMARRIAGSVELVAEEMERGNYLTRENCGSCELRSVCRTKYNLRLPEEKSGN